MLLKLGGQQQARKRRVALDQHGAGSTFPDFTTVFGADEAEIFPQDFQKRSSRIRRHFRLSRLTANRKSCFDRIKFDRTVKFQFSTVDG